MYTDEIEAPNSARRNGFSLFRPQIEKVEGVAGPARTPSGPASLLQAVKTAHGEAAILLPFRLLEKGPPNLSSLPLTLWQRAGNFYFSYFPDSPVLDITPPLRTSFIFGFGPA